jgi:hypothetical protein
LNAPSQNTDVTVLFKGKAGASGFRALKTDKGGWRYGFVALLKDGTRKYSDMGTANMESVTNPERSLTFNCPANCSKLWLVVSGAPQEHWRHPWDDNNTNDEHWPYQVQFKNTNLLGKTTGALTYILKKGPSQMYPNIIAGNIYLQGKANWQMANLAGKQILSGFGNSIDINDFSNGGYILSCSGKHFRIIKK